MATAKVIRNNPLKANNTHAEARTSYAICSTKNDLVFAAAEAGTIFQLDPHSGKITVHELDKTIDFYDIWAFADDDFIAVGTFGQIYRFDGTDWKLFSSPTDQWLEAIWGVSSDDFFVAGAKGLAFHFQHGQWTEIKHEKPNNRLYAIGGNADAVYFGGSFGTLFRVTKNSVDLVPTLSNSHLLGIAAIPNSDRVVVCGTEGCLFTVDGLDVEPIEVPTINALYGVDAKSETDICVVGWKGTGLHFTGGKWQAFDLGANSFMEGVAKTSNGYAAAGWFGRIMTFDTNHWTTHQTGRAERSIDICAMNSGRWLAATDTGNIVISAPSVAPKLLFTDPIDIGIVAPVSDTECLIAGKFFLAIVDTDSAAITDIKDGTKYDFTCGCRGDNFCFLGTSEGQVVKVDKATFQEVTQIRKIIKKRVIKGVVAFSSEKFAIQLSNGLLIIDTKQESKQEIEMPGDARLIGGHGRALLVTPEKLYALEDTGKISEIASASENFATVAEAISAARIVKDGSIVMAGSKGSVVVIPFGGGPKLIRSGLYRFVTCVDAAPDFSSVFCGTTGGTSVLINETKRQYASVSAPHYKTVSSAGLNFVLAGEGGVITTWNSKSETATILNENSNDFLCSIALNDKQVLAAGADSCALVSDSQVELADLNGLTITTLAMEGTKLFAGTSAGEVYEMSANEVTLPITQHLKPVMKGLNGAIVNLLFSKSDRYAVTDTGSVYRIGDNLELLYNFPLQRFERASSSQIDGAVPVAGSTNFFAYLDRKSIRIEELPEAIVVISLHGDVDLADYWLGGSSGTLLVTAEGKWFKVHTGIGNRLYGIAANEKHFVIGGTYGAIRFEDRSLVENEYKLDTRPSPQPILMRLGIKLGLPQNEQEEYEALPHLDRLLFGTMA